MSFGNLSEEILVEIVKWAGIDGEIDSWRSLVRCNWTLNRITTPCLYSTFTETTPSSVSRLLWAVLSNPRLATYIRTYSGDGSLANTISEDSDEDSDESIGSYYSENGLELCRQSMKKIGVSADVIEPWLDRINKGEWHALTSLLLLHLPNLEDLELCGHTYRPDHEGDITRALSIIRNYQDSSIPSPFSLINLTDLSLSPYSPAGDSDAGSIGDEVECFVPDDIMPFISIPSIRSLALSRLSTDERYYASQTTSIATSTIEELDLIDTSLDDRSLINFLRRFKTLRTLSYEHGFRIHYDFLPQEISKAISHLYCSLESLIITDNCEENGRYNTPRGIGSLAKFEKLKEVHMEVYTLLGYPDLGWRDSVQRDNVKIEEIIPESLELLDLRRVGSDTMCDDERLWGLLKAIESGKFAVLKRVVMSGFERYLKNPGALEIAFKDGGVEIILQLVN